MSSKISVVSLSLLLVLLFFSSCTNEDDRYAAVFERAFSAGITVTNDEMEYKATVTLYDITRDTNAEESIRASRDGNIIYTYPETLADITASRSGGGVTVSVCGTVVTPSASVGQRYISLLDSLDISSDELIEIRRDTLGDRDVKCVRFFHDGAEVRVWMDIEAVMPLLLETQGLRVVFDEFIYIT